MRIEPSPRYAVIFLVAMHLLFLGAMCCAQDMPESPEPLPDIVRDEIIRRGDQIEELGQIRTDSPQAYVFAALAPPPDDSHKWYISLVTTENCPWCELLKKHFAETEELRAWVNVENQEESWAHYNVYRQEDRTQDWRWQNVKFRGYPALIIQPPRNREWGDPSAVVMQKTGYDGNARALSASMRTSIETYVRALHVRGEVDGSQINQIYEAPYDRYKRQSHQQDDDDKSAAADEPVIERGAGQPPFPVPATPSDPRLPNPSVPLPEIPGPLDPDRRPLNPLEPQDDGQAATFDQLARLLPSADPTWITRQLQRGLTIDQARSAWEARQRAWTITLWVIGGMVLLILVMGATVVASVILAQRLTRSASGGQATDSGPDLTIRDPIPSQEKAGSGEQPKPS